MFLLALTSGKRRCVVAALVPNTDASHLQCAVGHSSVNLLPTLSFRTITRPASRPSVPWTIPSLAALVGWEDDRLLCPVRALRWFFGPHEDGRKTWPGLSALLPLDPAVPTTTPNMFSRLLCNTLFRAYFADGDAADTDIVRITAHDIRALPASWKASNCLPLDEVLRTAPWKNTKTIHRPHSTLRSSRPAKRRLSAGLLIVACRPPPVRSPMPLIPHPSVARYR